MQNNIKPEFNNYMYIIPNLTGITRDYTFYDNSMNFEFMDSINCYQNFIE